MKLVFEDDAFLAVDKPHGLLTVPGRTPDKADSLLTRLQAVRGAEHALLVHRLDRDTSGLILFAKTRDAQKRLGLRFERRQVEKHYEAIVHGIVEADEGTVDGPIKKDWTRNDPPVYVIHPGGRSAVTHWQVLSRGSNTTHLLLKPKTGRSHQLRVHCQSLGHPIIGDPIYAGEWLRPVAPKLSEGGNESEESEHPSLCLRATYLRFRHPIDKQWLTLMVPGLK